MKIFTPKTYLFTLIFFPSVLFGQMLTEDFETWPPTDWLIMTGDNGAGDSWDWDQFWDPNDAPSGENVARVNTEPDDNGAIPEDWLVTPELLPTAGFNTLTFYQSNWTATVDVSKLHVMVSTTSQSDQNSFTTLVTYTEADIDDNYVQSSIDLSAYNDTPIYIAFVVESDWGDDWYIDLVDGIYLFTPDPDASITAINGPGSDCGLSSSNTITATITNTGIETIINCPIEYNLNNGGWVSAGTYNGNITNGNSGTFSFDLDFSIVKDYELAVRTQYPGDEDPANDSLGLYTISNLEPSDLFQGNLTNTFENGVSQNGWNTVDVNGDGNGTTGQWSIATNGNGCGGDNYLVYTKNGNTANDWLFTPCLDFVSGETYRISVDYRTNGTGGLFGNGFNEKMLLAVGTSQDPADSPTVLNDLGTFNGTNCRTATGDFLASASGIYYFGIKCYSAANNGELRIDDITISIVPPSETTDATPVKVVVPNYNCGLNTSEDIEVTIKNEGANDITTCAIEYNLNNEGWTSAGTYTGNIAYGLTDVYTFNMDMTGRANQSLNVRTRLTGDGVPANDELTGYTVPDFQAHDFDVSDYSMGFENGEDYSNWRIYDNNNDADGDEGTWAFKNNGYSCDGFGYAQYTFDRNNAADDWIFTPCLSLEANETYKITFDYNAQYPLLGAYLEKMKVAIGQTSTPAGMSTILNDYGTFAKIPIFGTCYDGDIDFTVPSDGVYYIGWHAYSDADQFYVILDNINIIRTTPETYYSVAVGDADEAVWAPTRNGTPQEITFKSTNTLIIQDNFDVNVNVDMVADDLTIEPGANLTAYNGRSITIHGDWTNNGTFDYPNTTIIMSGSGAQQIIGENIFDNLTIDSPNGITMDGLNDTVIGTLDVEQGILNTGDALVLRSDANGTANVTTINSGDIIGEVTVERYIPAGETNYRMMASAVQNATIQDWKDDFLTSGFQGSHWPDWPTAANPFYSITYYDESENGSQNQGYTPPNSASDQLIPGRGYWIWCGDRMSGTAEFTTDVVGPLNTGNIDANLQYTNTGDPAADGWNLIGNPYASDIDWSGILNADLSNKYYIYDPQSGNMDLWNELDGSNLYYLNGDIKSGQSFWVHANNATNLIIEEVDKTSGAVGLFEQENYPDFPELQIDINSSMNDFYDRTKLKWNDLAFEGVDDYDASKFDYGNYYAPRIAFQVGENSLAICAQPTPTEAFDLPIKVWSNRAGNYTLTFNPDENFINTTCLHVFDTESNQTITLSPGLQLPITLENGVPNTRYRLQISGSIQHTQHDISCHGKQDGRITITPPTSDNWDYSLTDKDGNVLEQISGNGIQSFTNLSDGEYTLNMDHVSCGSKVIPLVITEPDLLSIGANATSETCYGANDGSLSITALGGIAPYEITVDGQPYHNPLTQLNPGIYEVSISDNKGCTANMDNIIVKAGKEIWFGVDQSKTQVVIEENTPVQFSYFGETPDKIVWTFGDGSYSTNAQTSHTFTEIGTYEINVSVTVDGCTASHSPLFVDAVSNPTSVEAINHVTEFADVNYFNGQITITWLSQISSSEYRLTDVNGRTIKTGNLTTQSNGEISIIQANELSAGQYFFTIENGVLNKTWKLAIIE